MKNVLDCLFCFNKMKFSLHFFMTVFVLHVKFLNDQNFDKILSSLNLLFSELCAKKKIVKTASCTRN